MKKQLIKFLPAIGMAVVAGLMELFEGIDEQKTEDKIEELESRIATLEGGVKHEN